MILPRYHQKNDKVDPRKLPGSSNNQTQQLDNEELRKDISGIQITFLSELCKSVTKSIFRKLLNQKLLESESPSRYPFFFGDNEPTLPTKANKAESVISASRFFVPDSFFLHR